jgi:raffinose/stachyose/melibiose transport system permease protein
LKTTAAAADGAKAKPAKKRKKAAYKSGHSSMTKRSLRKWSWLFIGPVFAAFIIGFIWPFAQGIYLSFCGKFSVISQARLQGIENYIKAFSDETFYHSFWFTALFAVVSVILINLLAFAIAYALTQGVKGSNLFRTVFFMPNLIGGIVLGYLWSMIFDGLLDLWTTQNLVDNATYGFWGLIILLLWQQVGYMMIIYIAGLQAVPDDMLEAAKIDGATKTQTLFKVIIPNVMPSITICTFLTLTNSFKLFDQNLALTGGKPGRLTEMLALNISNGYSNMATRGMAQAKAVIFFLLVAALGIAQLVATRRKEVQQ